MSVHNVDPGQAAEARKLALEAEDREREAKAEEERKNRGFTQVYDLGWKRLQELVRSNPPAARLYMWVAEHSDGPGVVVASQEVIAEQLNIHRTTVWRLCKALEQANALVRVKLQGNVYAYALSPYEIWKSWSTTKDTAVFLTKTMANKLDPANKLVDRKLRLMMGETVPDEADESIESASPSTTPSEQAPRPKRRGRPPGSGKRQKEAKAAT